MVQTLSGRLHVIGYSMLGKAECLSFSSSQVLKIRNISLSKKKQKQKNPPKHRPSFSLGPDNFVSQCRTESKTRALELQGVDILIL